MGCTASASIDSLKSEIRSSHAKRHVYPVAADANDLSGLLSKNHNRGKLKENAKNGISAAMRPSAWQVMAMTAEFTKRYPQLYELLLQQGRSMEYDSVIVVDVSRAIPTVPFFGTSEAPGDGQSQLYRILTAYAHLDRHVGYCQGMHFIAALLLLVGIPETAAFYTFASIMLRFGLAGLYAPGLPMLHTSTSVLNSLLGHRKPVLFKHMQHQLAIPASLYATPWFMSGFVSSCLPLSTCVALMDFMLCEQEASPLPAFIDGLYHSLQALYPAVVIMSPPARQAPKRVPSRGPGLPVPPAAGDGSGDAPAERRGKGVKGKKSSMKGARVGPEDDGGESVKDVVSLLPTLYLRAALVLLHKFEERLLASTSLEEAFMVLKCLPPSYEALAQDLNLSSASFSVPTHPRSLDLGPKRRSRLTVTRDDGVSSASQSAVGGGPVQDSADEPSAIVQFVKALEMLDALDDTYALAESMARDKKRIAQYPALAPNCTPEGFIIPTTLSPSGALGLPRSSADPAAVVVKSDKSSVASQQSIEEISDDVVTRMVASITAPAAPEGRPNPHLFSLKLPADSSNPPVCEYVMDDGKPINVPGVGESKQPESDAAKVSMTSPTALMSPTMMSTLDCVCDGKLVPGWMLPRQFRALLNHHQYLVPMAQFEAAVKAANSLSVATLYS